MFLSIIYSASYCFTIFDYKLQSNLFSGRLFSQQVSVKIAVILRIKLASGTQTQHEFLCFIDINKKVTYGIRRFNSMILSALKEAIAQMCSVKIFSLKISQNSQEKNLCQSLFLNKVTGLRHRYFLVNFTKFLKRAIHYQINQIQFI